MRRGLATVLLLSGALKVLLAVVFADLSPHYDEWEFLEFGRRIVAGDPPVLWRAPGYQSFVALGLWVAGGHPVGVRLLQALLSVATTLLVYRLGRRVGNERVALAAAAFVAFYPSHVAFSHLFWAETLFLFLTLLAFDRLLEAERQDSLAGPAVVGVLLGAASLVRSAGVPLLAVSAVWLALAGGRRTRALALLAAGAVVIAPWSIHGSVRAGRFVLIDTNPGWNLWSGNNEYIAPDLQGVWGTGLRLKNGLEQAWGPRLEARGIPAEFAGVRLEGEWRAVVRERLVADGIRDRSSPEADAWYRTRALEEMRRDPAGVIARVPKKLAGFWSPDFFFPRHVLRDWYGASPPALAAALVALTWLAALVPLVAGPAALLAGPVNTFRTLAGAWIGVSAVVHAFVFGVSRMHQGLVPLLVVAVSLVCFGDRPAHRVRAGVGAAVALLLVVLSLPAVVGVYLAPSPRHAGTVRALATVRHLPMPGARHAAYLLAEVEAANGRDDAAPRALDAAPADDPGTMLLRALVAATPTERAEMAQRASAARPESHLLRSLERRTAAEARLGGDP